MKRRTVPMIVALLLPLLGPVTFFWMFNADEAEAAVVASADGASIHYEVQGAGEPTLVFVHGWSCDAGYWREQVAPFAAAHRVVALDLAGHGASGLERTDYTMAAFGADVVAVLAAEGIDDAILIGHSMGGPVVVEAALAAPQRVRGLIGIDNFQDMHAALTAEQIAGFAGAMQADFAGTVVPWVRSMFPADADPALVEQIAVDMAAAPPAVGISAIAHTLAWMGGGGSGRLPLLAVNLTTISGDRHPTDVAGNRTLVPGFALRLMTDTGHFPMLEKPGEFNGLLAEAIAEFNGEGAAPTAPGALRLEN